MIDPPWEKKKGGKRKVRPKQGKSLDYKTMSVPYIFKLLDSEIFSIANKNHTVFMWTIDEFIFDCEKEMRERGYRMHCRMIWNKMNGVAPAFSVRYSHEYLIWFYKEKFQNIDKSVRGKFTTVFEERARQHSRKPDFAYDMIEKMFPNKTLMDVFSRESRLKWKQFGNEVNKFSEQLDLTLDT